MKKFFKNKFVKVALFVVFPWLAPWLAHASTSTIEVDPGFNALVWAQAQSIWDGFSNPIVLILGTILALFVIGEIIGMMKHKGGG